MIGAVHGAWCGARTWPTKCPSCGGAVFFFTCSHGSAVFFESLGAPWPVHDCDTSWARRLKRTTAADGSAVVTLGPGITVTRPAEGFRIDPAFLHKPKHKKAADDPIKAVGPTDDATKELVGILREKTNRADPYRAFGITEGSLGAMFLGPIGAQPMSKATIHVHLEADSPIESYTVWVPRELLVQPQIKRGVTVMLHLDVLRVGESRMWYCDNFQLVG